METEIKTAIQKHELVDQVMNYVKNDNLTYYEAILEICSEHDIDPEDMAPMISGPLREKLRVEAMKRNIIPNTEGNSIDGI